MESFFWRFEIHIPVSFGIITPLKRNKNPGGSIIVNYQLIQTAEKLPEQHYEKKITKNIKPTDILKI